MEIVFKIKKQNLQKVKNIFLTDDVISRASVMFKESKSLGFKDNEYYCYISGSDEACKKAKKSISDLGETVKKTDKKKIIEKIKEEEDMAMSGFGNIFG